MPSILNAPYWHTKAQEARALASETKSIKAKQILLDNADYYERLAMNAPLRVIQGGRE
jgi:hypothetical protein